MVWTVSIQVRVSGFPMSFLAARGEITLRGSDYVQLVVQFFGKV